MTQATKIPGTDEAWDNGTLGEEEQYVAVADKALQDAVHQSLGMQAISIRLPKDLVEQYKIIAHYHSMGYQPLMREALTRFATAEMKRILVEVSNERDRERQERSKATPQQKAAPQPHRKAA